ncbi:DUF6776 family protein [Shewanella glacialimarina]|jgi:hypothetical protein|uniref:DUF6776 family protein n=1 Tax=Shewanella glacialimarina TaxID=2590884 RepID=UPI001CF8B0CE|nr:DUF6776 family protein [Shewanella glacialimarina]UCX05585.1 hypothetical protein FJ709_14500 [Shewanella glacialimarina]
MLNYHRLLDKLKVIERQKRASGTYLITLVLIAFITGALCHQIWLSFAPEAAPNSESGKRKLILELDLQAKALASRNLALTIEQEANKNLQQMFSDQLIHQKNLEKELSFYRSLMIPDAEVEGVLIHGVELNRGILPEQQQLRVILTQQQKRQANLTVSIDADFIGVQNNQVSELNLTKLTDKKYNIDFKYFHIMEVDVTLPDSFTLQRVRIKVKVKPARGIKGGVVEQVYNIEDIVSTGT